jgi:CheY-like chemotaxis protein
MNSLAHQLDAGVDRPTVLVVEDEVLVRLMIADELRRHGLNVLEACTAEEAISVLQSSIPVNLLLTDIQMPGKFDGLDLAALVRGAFPSVKVVVASGYRPENPLRQIAHAFFFKPYDPAVLASRVKELAVDSVQDACEP